MNRQNHQKALDTHEIKEETLSSEEFNNQVYVCKKALKPKQTPPLRAQEHHRKT